MFMQYKPLKSVFVWLVLVLFLLVFSLSLQALNTFNTKGWDKNKWKEESIRILYVISIQIFNRDMSEVHTHMYICTYIYMYTYVEIHMHIYLQNNP